MSSEATITTLCRGCMSPKPCACGFDEAAYAPAPHQLPADTILHGKYLLGKVIGEGGFGITYIGRDLTLDLKVAVKEFYPTGFVTRESTVTNTVQPFTGTQGEFFRRGRDRFIEEARMLARFSSMPGIVSVRDFFQENGTAYIVMEYIDGQTFKSYLEAMGGRLPAVQVTEMMSPVMQSLAVIHSAGLIHRDISPDNIMISREGFVKLLDFGAAKEFAGSGNRSLSIMLKPGYSPEEQYRSRGVQGPWTDIYALCATMYRAITGAMPEESTERLRRDTMQTPSQLGVSIAPAQEAALLKGMAVLQEDRWQDIRALMAAIETKYERTVMPPPAASPVPATPKKEKPPKKERVPFVWPLSGKLTGILAGALALVIIAGVGVLIKKRDNSGLPVNAPTTEITEEGTEAPTTTDSRVYVTDMSYTITQFDKQYSGRYTGYVINNKPSDSNGTLIYDDDGYKYVGGWDEGIFNGQGSFYGYDTFLVYVGTFEDGKYHGQGTHYYALGAEYVGTWKNGKRNGQGTMTYDGYDFNYSGGWWDGGIRTGELFGTSLDGDKYVGEWKDDKKNGYGTYFNPDGTILKQGQWENGEFVGSATTAATTTTEATTTSTTTKPATTVAVAAGAVYVTNQAYICPYIFVTANSSGTYTGGWLNGMPADGGKGTFKYGLGVEYTGYWKNGMPNGQGKSVTLGLLVYEGEWKDGKYHGYGTTYGFSGAIASQGQWKNGFFVG